MKPKEQRLAGILIGLKATIQDAMQRVNANTHGIALIVDADGKLLHTVTDGDLRRAMLQGLDLSSPIERLVQSKEPGPAARPIAAPVTTPPADQLALMRQYQVRHLPLLDDAERVVELALLDDFVASNAPTQAIVMAGGLGTRLRPLTQDKPKPLLSIGDRPIMQRVIEQLQEAGIRQVNISTHFLGQQIEDFFGDGRRFGVDIGYLKEEHPLGTAGALSLMEPPKEPLLVVNGDILTRVDFRALANFHQEYAPAMTVAVKRYDVQVPYGVVDVEGVRITHWTEKPSTSFFIAAGIYLISPEAWRFLERGQACDMPALIERLLKNGCSVVSFPISEYWLDIGKLDDYQSAQNDVASGQF